MHNERGTTVPLSCFNLFVEGYPDAASTLVHNTLSGAYLVLDADAVVALRKADAGEPLTEAERALVDDPDMVELTDPDVGVLVESREAEEREFRAWFERKRSAAHTRSLDALVSVNLACNFDCPYCCQASIMDGSVMKPEVADQTADWLAARALAAGVEHIKLAFCGGEPLLHPERIRRITRRVREQVAAAGVKVSFALITNGYFLTPELCDEMVELGLTAAKITLDGDETTHSKTRVSKKGEDTFHRIFGHILYASRKLRVMVNGNYDATNRSGFLPLIAKLKAAGLPEGNPVNFTPALDGLVALDWNGGGMCSWSESDMSDHILMQDEILRSGFSIRAINATGPCTFHDHESFAIEPDGTIQKCPGFMGHPEWALGHVARGIEGEMYGTMIRATPQASCTGCAHRPNCGGGCLAIEWLKTGQPAGVNCEKPYFERVKEEAVVRHYLLATSETQEEAVAAFPPPRSSQNAAPAHTRRPAALRVVAA